mmetsp:Transcript_108638/g.171434  ORF Transcript_108638/g.171434 Transcript_108638/m.171434 type:complete len:117 (-) Transcript_108638:81-431(-)|eukprot:CAMPEP_0169061430 /NCGR_PEP_ID=MMETSP1015-20121227/109_1 /TAXON_ID=342587 /ORGANISM="Karlodinium micrum, Strain CCMP2283" /LENGTH=116 /DNA_ID=CAMNT_0009119423 /DNA_START=43 /DNA_END=393 /DNA_ORIENTATION=-
MGRFLCLLIITASPVEMNAARVDVTTAVEALEDISDDSKPYAEEKNMPAINASEGSQQVVNETHVVKNQTIALHDTRRMMYCNTNRGLCAKSGDGCAYAKNIRGECNGSLECCTGR